MLRAYTQVTRNSTYFLDPNAPKCPKWSGMVQVCPFSALKLHPLHKSRSLAVALVTHREHPDGALQICGDNPSPGNAGNGIKEWEIWFCGGLNTYRTWAPHSSQSVSTTLLRRVSHSIQHPCSRVPGTMPTENHGKIHPARIVHDPPWGAALHHATSSPYFISTQWGFVIIAHWHHWHHWPPKRHTKTHQVKKTCQKLFSDPTSLWCQTTGALVAVVGASLARKTCGDL